jgi:hypothetical protein
MGLLLLPSRLRHVSLMGFQDATLYGLIPGTMTPQVLQGVQLAHDALSHLAA